jgi:hypothetical protein
MNFRLESDGAAKPAEDGQIIADQRVDDSKHSEPVFQSPLKAGGIGRNSAPQFTPSALFAQLSLAQIGVALFSPKKGHRCLILNILRAIYNIHDLPPDTNSVAGSNILNDLVKLARLGVAIAPDLNLNLVVGHRTSFHRRLSAHLP